MNLEANAECKIVKSTRGYRRYFKYFSACSVVRLQIKMGGMLIAVFDMPYYKGDRERFLLR